LGKLGKRCRGTWQLRLLMLFTDADLGGLLC